MWNKGVYTVAEIARKLRVDCSDIEHEVQAGRLAAIVVAGKTRIVDAEWQRFSGQHSKVQRFPLLWRATAIAAMVVTTTVLAMDLPFPVWQAEEIAPQTALFKDSATLNDGDPQRFSPVNAPLDYRRYNEAANPNGRGFTQSLMSLQQQNNVEPGSLSFPWTQFIRLDTNHDRGDGTGLIVNLHNRGSGWATGYHVDSFAWGNGTTLGSNIEMRDMAGQGAYTVGMNIQNKAFPADIGLQVQIGPLRQNHPLWQQGMDGRWLTGIKLASDVDGGVFDTGIELGQNTAGERGLWLRGKYTKGIDLGKNSLTMQAGSLLQLADSQQIGMRFNASRQRIEFVQAGQVIAFLDSRRRNVDLAN